VDRHHPDPNVHFDADPEPHPDWHQNDADPSPKLHITHVGKLGISFKFIRSFRIQVNYVFLFSLKANVL
jgi:hypothetical protein